jgi:hypothetical protein
MTIDNFFIFSPSSYYHLDKMQPVTPAAALDLKIQMRSYWRLEPQLAASGAPDFDILLLFQPLHLRSHRPRRQSVNLKQEIPIREPPPFKPRFEITRRNHFTRLYSHRVAYYFTHLVRRQ